MPNLNVQITAAGPIIDVHVGIPAPHREALQQAGVAVPAPVACRLLIDTGASSTVLDTLVIKALGLLPSGSVSVHTASTDAGNMHQCFQYAVSLTIVHTSINWTFSALPVLESALSHQGIDGLLGRDILSKCLLVYNGHLGLFTLAF